MPADWSLEQDAAGRGTMPCPVLPPYGQAARQKEPRRLNPVGAMQAAATMTACICSGSSGETPCPTLKVLSA